MGFRVRGLGFRVGFRVSGLFRVWVRDLRVSVLGLDRFNP